MPQGAPDFSDIDDFVSSQQKSTPSSFDDIDSFVAQNDKSAPAASPAKIPAAAQPEGWWQKLLNPQIVTRNPKLATATTSPEAFTAENPAIQDVKAIGAGAKAIATVPSPVNLPSPRGAGAGVPVPPQPGDVSLPQRQEAAAEALEHAGHLAMLPAVASGIGAPVEAVEALALGYAASKAAKYGAKAVGGSELAQRLAEDAGWLVAPAKFGESFRAPEMRTTEGAAQIFENLVYKAGSEVPKGATEAQAGAAFKSAMANLHPDVTSAHVEDATNLSAAYAKLKQDGYFKTQQDVAKDIGFWAPKTARQLTGQAEPQPAPVPASAPPPIPQPSDDPIIQAAGSMARAQASEQQAKMAVAGVPPPPPPALPQVSDNPGAPDTLQHGHITPQDVEGFAKAANALPPAQRAQAVQEAHETLSKVLLEQGAKGPVVLPSGKLAIIKTPEDSQKIALDIINSAVDDHDKAQKEIAKNATETKPSVAKSEPAPAPAPRQPSAIEQALTARRQQPDFSDVDDFVAKNVQSPREADNNARRGGSEQPTNGAGNGGGSSSPEAIRGEAVQESGANIARTGRQAFQKGDRVALQDGTEATVIFTHPSQAIVRVKTDDGTKLSTGISKVKSLERAGSGAPETGKSGPVSGSDQQHGERGVGSRAASGVLAEAPTVKGVVPKEAPKDGLGGKSQEARTQHSLDTERTETGKVLGHPLLNDTPPAEDLGAKVRNSKPALPRTGDEVAPGKIGEMKISDLKVAPNKFQYKLNTDAEGTGTLLKEQSKFNHDLAGTISVWKDPADGKFYVVNGHHRYELAKRTGEKTIGVRHIAASDATAARSIGAMQNIAEGRGTPVDAAKFMRDTGISAEHLKEKGISLGEATAAKGVALSKLDEPMFNRVVKGDLSLGRAVAIGESSDDPAEQKAILSLVEKKEAKGGKVNDDTLKELIRLVKGSEQTTETTGNLFGTQEITRSLALEKAEISAHIKQQLAKDKKLFGFVAKGDRAEELKRAGNKIDVEKSKEISSGAAQAEEVYNKLSSRGGPISSILDESARQLADGENAGKVKSDAYARVRREVSKTLGTPEERSVERPEGTPEPAKTSEGTTSKSENPGVGGNDATRTTGDRESGRASEEPRKEVEPTLPGMEHVPSERAEASAEQQGKDLTEKLTEPPKSIEGKAGEMEQKSPLFRDTEANPQNSLFGHLSEESGEFDPSKLSSAVSELVKQDVAPALKTAGIGIKDIAGFFVKALYPRIEESSVVGRALGVAAPTDAVDVLMKLQGERAKTLAEFDGIMHGMEKMFDRMPEANRVDFIDRIQTGKLQPTLQLRELADAIKKIQALQRDQEQSAANLGKSSFVKLPEKANYFNNRWDKPPGGGKSEDDEQRLTQLFTPRRPLEGSKSYNKQQSYTLKSGIAAGGKPVSTNPIRLLRLRLEDGIKFVTARRAWHDVGELDLRQFVPRGERIPDGFDRVDDKIAKVYFPAELANGKTTAVEGGQWAVEANTARLLNNMLSKDYIRTNPAGKGLMWLKNVSTALELGLSPFHAVFETIEAASAQMALGGLRAYNLGIRGGSAREFTAGLRQILESPVAPIAMAREGSALPAYVESRARLNKIGVSQFGHHQIEGKQPHGIMDALKGFHEVRKQAGIRRLLKRYPDLDQLVDDMFTGGLVIGQHEDYKVQMLGKTASEAWSSGNPLGALVRAVPTVLQATMKPLFQWYIPNLKYSLFMRLMSEQAAENAGALEDGSMTRAEIARKVADSVENRFGELNFDNLFWNRTWKTALQFAFRSVTWKLGTARELGGGTVGQAKDFGQWAWQAHKMFGGEPSSSAGKGEIPFPDAEANPGPLPKLNMKFASLMGLILTTSAMGIIGSKILSGKYPWEWTKEGAEGKAESSWDWFKSIYLETTHPRTGDLDSRNKPVRISLPTYWKDVEHLTKDPKQEIVGSLSSTLGKAIDLEHNEDYFGNYVYNPNAPLGTQLKQAGKYAFPSPFSITSYQRGKETGGTRLALLGSFGFAKAPADLDFTPAEKLAGALLKIREPKHTPEELQEWQEKHDAFKNGDLSPRDARQFVNNQRLTWLEREAKKLTYSEALRVEEVANESEKDSVRRIVREKRANLLKRGGAAKVEAAEVTP